MPVIFVPVASMSIASPSPAKPVSLACKPRAGGPSCGKLRVDNWVNNIATDMLDVPHLHITLTTDDLLRPFFFTDRSLLKLLLQVAAQAVREVLEDLYPDLRIGMVYTVHTFGRDLGFKPHVHLVTPAPTAGTVSPKAI
jgi:Transposase zinc-binding domain/Putative transposase